MELEDLHGLAFQLPLIQATGYQPKAIKVASDEIAMGYAHLQIVLCRNFEFGNVYWPARSKFNTR